MGGLAGYYNLIREISVSDFKLRYKNSTLGFVWVILEPLAMMSIMYVIFARIVRIQIDNYQLFLLIGLVQWQLFSRGTNSGINILVGRSDILKKIYFPRKVMVFSACLTTLFMACFEMLIFLVMGLIFGLDFRPGLLWLVPLFLLEFVVIYTICLFLAPLNLRMRDLQNTWNIVIRMGFYLSPVLYSVDFIPERFRGLYLFNPMARIIHFTRHVVFPEANYIDHWFWPFVALVLVLFIAANLLFTKLEPRFGDYV
ncbi:MAG: ABC transporter permease [Candidatus Alcyoniella australis]|nr:ABC transporter permease [Candidatus Alcyoniella australis]